jgi:hypothetical protein
MSSFSSQTKNALATDEHGYDNEDLAFIRVHPCSSVANFVFVRTAKLAHSFSRHDPICGMRMNSSSNQTKNGFATDEQMNTDKRGVPLE